MKITILQEKLKKGIGLVEKITSKSLSLPILNNVFLEAKKNFLKLSSTDLELGINWWSLCKTEKEGTITVPSRLLFDLINLLPNKKITLETKNNTLFIEYNKNISQIKGMPADEFPIIPKVSTEEFITTKGSAFSRILSSVVDIASPSTTRPEISGVFLVFQKDLITAVSTDSFRLGEKKLFLKPSSNFEKKVSLILPQKTAKEIINIFGEVSEDIKIYFSPNQVMFESLMEETEHPQTQLVSRLIEGEYPNYQEIIPKKYNTRLVLKKDELLTQIKTAGLFSGKVSEVKFKIEPAKNDIEISSRNPETGEYRSEINGKIKGEAVEISFNYRFLLDGLLNIKSTEIIFELNTSSGPGVLKPVGDESYIYVVMPIKSA